MAFNGARNVILEAFQSQHKVEPSATGIYMLPGLVRELWMQSSSFSLVGKYPVSFLNNSVFYANMSSRVVFLSITGSS